MIITIHVVTSRFLHSVSVGLFQTNQVVIADFGMAIQIQSDINHWQKEVVSDVVLMTRRGWLRRIASEIGNSREMNLCIGDSISIAVWKSFPYGTGNAGQSALHRGRGRVQLRCYPVRVDDSNIRQSGHPTRSQSLHGYGYGEGASSGQRGLSNSSVLYCA